MKRTIAICLLGSALLGGPVIVRGEDQTQPSIQAMIAGLFFDDHTYMAETSVRLPIFREGSQTQFLTTRNRLESDWAFGDGLRLIAVGGLHRTAFQDRPGSLEAYEIGAGIGSALRREPGLFDWSVVVGGYVGREHLEANWWADMHATWRAFELPQGQMMATAFHPFLGLAADVE